MTDDKKPDEVKEESSIKFDFESEYGPPIHALPELVDRSLNEPDCGITEFVSPDTPGFGAIIKHRYSDFNVFEILSDDTVVHLKSTNVPKVEELAAISADKFPKYNDLDEGDRKLVSALSWTRIIHIATKYLGGEKHSEAEVISIDVTKLEKEERKRIHGLIKLHFPHLTSNTSQKVTPEGHKSILGVCFKPKKINENEWPRDRPKYLKFTLYKEDLDQHFVLSQLSRGLNSFKDKFSMAGTKDKRGRTSQKITACWLTPEKLLSAFKKTNLKEEKIAIGDFEYVSEALKLGNSNGNRFSLVLRSVQGTEEIVNNALASLRDKGFINYFGLQRFGTSLIKTSDIGLALIKQEWQKAVEMILKPRPNERLFLRKVREFWWQYRDAKQALKMLGRKNENLVEARLLLGLKMCNTADLVGALNMIQKNVRLMYLHAYQSHIFNSVVSQRIKKFGLKVLPGDLTLPNDAQLEELQDEEDVKDPKEKNDLPSVNVVHDVANVRIQDIVMPLPGYKVTYPDNELKQLYEESLAKDGLTLDSFRNSVKAYQLGGNYRHILGTVTEMSWTMINYSDPNENLVLSDRERMQGLPEIKGDPDGKYKAVVVDFSLKSSQYATMALREAMKEDTGRDHQALLTQKHLAEYIASQPSVEKEVEEETGEPQAKKAKEEIAQ